VFCLLVLQKTVLIAQIAEFRGPGVHHNFDDSDSGYDVDMDQKLKSFGGNQRGRIILLGDGTEVLTDSDDIEMFDRGEEDKDLASQVHKGQTTGHETTEQPAEANSSTLSEKIDNTDPQYKPVTDNVLTNSEDPTEKNAEETSSDAKEK
jgi:protein phosphatase PTC2/3